MKPKKYFSDIKIPIIEFGLSHNGEIILYERMGRGRYDEFSPINPNQVKKQELTRIDPVKSDEREEINSLELTLKKATQQLLSDSMPHMEKLRWKNIKSRAKYLVFIKEGDTEVYNHLKLKHFKGLEEVGLAFREHHLLVYLESGKTNTREIPIWLVLNNFYNID